MAADRSDDELARTATAPGSDGGAGTAMPALSGSLGRYRLERELGVGGMGVVHAAFDPDLERRVALKVLKTDRGDDEARQRLLREARAMARLTHPNVVAVHEVGSAGGRDYVAMELVEGETLDQWLKEAHRTPAEIVPAFLAAGRGLAAAHAAGLVHRDFKPHNVLRRRDGRIAVTDFGLARAEGISDAKSELKSEARTEAKIDAQSTLTKTGSVLGTPAYMAPEQWEGGHVGPAADQFAFCVALWEALTGERPFKGETLDTLKQSVRRGVAALDASKLPRRLRRPMRRGLDPDPARRWPSMDALLAAMTRAERRPGAVVAIVCGAIVAAAALYLALGRGGAGPSCERPALDPDHVWSSQQSAAFARADQPLAAIALDADFSRWKAARARACAADPGAREPRLTCLDGVLTRISVVAKAIAAVKNAPRIEVGDALIDPAVCEAPRPPRLLVGASPELRQVLTRSFELSVSKQPLEPAQADALVASVQAEPCAGSFAHLLALSTRKTTGERMRDLDEADRLAQRCGDDWLIADIAVASASDALDSNPSLTTEVTAKIKHAEALAEPVMQPDLQADLLLLRRRVAERSNDLDTAMALTRDASKAYDSRGRVRAYVGNELHLLELREMRANPDDLAGIPKRIGELRDLAAKRLGANDDVVHAADSALGVYQWKIGEVAAAHAKLAASRTPLPIENPTHITGTVVDETGAPVANATVVAAPALAGDSVSVAIPNDFARRAMTRADGTFELTDCASDGVIVAEAGDKRSLPAAIASGVTLALAPTSRIEGTVDLKGRAPSTVQIAVKRVDQAVILRYSLVAPVLPDGRFTIDGVPRGHLVISTEVSKTSTAAIQATELTVDQPVVKGVQLVVGGSKRVLHVIVRSTAAGPLASAQVVVLPGHVESSNALALSQSLRNANIEWARQIEGEQVPKPVLAVAKRGDMYATVREVPEGDASACAVGLPDKIDEAMAKSFQQHMDKIEVRCAPVSSTDDVVVVEVPPFPRLD